MPKPDPYEPGPHRSDDAPAPPKKTQGGALAPPPEGPGRDQMERRVERAFRCRSCGEQVPPDDPSKPPVPIRPAWREGAVLAYPCACGGQVEVTTRDLVKWLRLDRAGRAPLALRNIDAAVGVAKEAQRKAADKGDYSASASNGTLLARLEEANLKMAGVFTEQVEVTHRFAPPEDDPEVQAQLQKWWDERAKVIDVEPVPPKGAG